MIKHLTQGDVPSWMYLTAKIAAWNAARILRIPAPKVRWFAPDYHEDRAGFVNKDVKDTIFLSRKWAQKNGVKQLQGLTYHECRHLWQWKHDYLQGRDERRKAENDANKFVFDQLKILPKLQMWINTDHYD